MDPIPVTTVTCTWCRAVAAPSAVRCAQVVEGGLRVTWHWPQCPHWVADRIVAGRDRPRPER